MKELTENHWPFDQPRNCAVFTVKSIVNGTNPILYVSHDLDDHGWQFHAGGIPNEKDAMVVALSEILEIDPTIEQLATMPPGFHAERSSRHQPWKIEISENQEER